jgi:hypothetical protein
VHAAYGLSDVFDLRLELAGSRQTIKPRTVEERREPVVADLYAARLGLAYKLDVIQWIPYLGVRAGAVGVSDPVPPFESLSPSVGGIAGVDYAMSRSLGFGLQLSLDYLLAGEGNQLFGGLITAEYHFGY